MIFSRRYHYALKNKKISLSISPKVREKLLFYLKHYNDHTSHKIDGFNYNSSILEDVLKDLKFELGLETIPNIKTIISEGKPEYIFDLLELTYEALYKNNKHQFKLKVNDVFELFEHPWRLSNGEIFKLDNDFLGAKLASKGNDLLMENNFSGALEEYEKARRELTSGEIKGAIGDAGQSFESVMSTITKLKGLNASDLIIKLGEQGYFDDLPEDMREGFKDQVLRAVPFMRNKFKSAHGQGSKIINIPQEYGELCLDLVASLNRFLISKYLLREKPEKDTEDSVIDLQDLPY